MCCALQYYNDAIMSAMASQITVVSMVCSTVCSGADQRKHQSSASLAFVREKPVTGEFPSQMTNNAENVSMWRRHHVLSCPIISSCFVSEFIVQRWISNKGPVMCKAFQCHMYHFAVKRQKLDKIHHVHYLVIYFNLLYNLRFPSSPPILIPCAPTWL